MWLAACKKILRPECIWITKLENWWWWVFVACIYPLDWGANGVYKRRMQKKKKKQPNQTYILTLLCSVTLEMKVELSKQF